MGIERFNIRKNRDAVFMTQGDKGMIMHTNEQQRGVWDPRGTTFFTTVHTHNKSPLFKDRRLAGLMVDAIRWLANTETCVVHSWVVMPDHIHLLMSTGCNGETPGGATTPPEQIMDKLKFFPAQRISRLVFKTHIWEDEDQVQPIDNEVDFYRHMLFILENPRCAGLVKSYSEYPYLDIPGGCLLQEGLLDVDESLVP